MDRHLVALAAVATAATAVAGGAGDAAGIVAGVAIAVLATRRLRGTQGHAAPVARALHAAVCCWMLYDVAYALGMPFDRVPELAGYVLAGVAAVRVARTLGDAFLRVVLRDAAWAAVAVVAIAADPADLGGSGPVLVTLGAGVVCTATWLQFSLVQRGPSAAVGWFWAAIGLMLTSLATEVGLASAPVDVDVVSATGLAGRLVLVVAASHPGVELLLTPPDGDRDRTAGSRAVLAVALLAVVTAAASAHQLLGRGIAPWQALVPLLVLAITTRRTLALHRGAAEDNRALRRSALRDAATGVHNARGLRQLLAVDDVDGHVLLVVELAGLRMVLRRLDALAAATLERSVVARLAATCGSTGVVARCDTSEFAVLADVEPWRLPGAVRQALTDELRLPAASVSVQVLVRTGWTVVRRECPEEALEEARFAAQESVGGEAVQFAAAERQRYREQRALLHEFPAAVADGSVVGHYQPVVDVRTGRITGFEVLARWPHPRLGMVSPVVFIPLAESSGAIVALGMTLLRDACRQLALWRQLPGHEQLGVAVNLSPRQLAEPGLCGDVMDALASAGLPPEALTLELTEEVVTDLARGAPVLRELQAHGVAVAVDDFGTGYSSLAYLDELRPDVVKVDRRFTQALTAPDGDVARGIFELLGGLRLPVVAEGVEDEATLAALRELGCERWQGFLHARPMPAAEATALLGGPSPATAAERRTRPGVLSP